MGGRVVRVSWFETDIAGIAESAVRLHGAVQKPAELAKFIAMVRDLEPQVIVEIGSYAGGTLWAWTQLAASVFAVDLPSTGLYAATGGPQEAHGCHIVVGDSHDPLTRETLRSALQGRPVDVLFIDGDHSYDGVKADHEMYAPLVREGGLIGFHDIIEHTDNADIQVHRYWADIGGGLEIIDPSEPPWGGIGVLHATGT